MASLVLAGGSVAAAANGAPSLNARMLSISNMPTGWSVTHDSGRSSSPAPCGLSVFRTPTRHGERKTVTFADGPTTAFEEGLATGGGELRRWRALAHHLSTCHQPSITDHGKAAKLAIGAMSFPAISRATHAFSISYTVTGVDVGTDVVLFRVPKYEGFVLYGTLGTPRVKTVERFAKAAVQKAEGKPGASPGRRVQRRRMSPRQRRRESTKRSLRSGRRL